MGIFEGKKERSDCLEKLYKALPVFPVKESSALLVALFHQEGHCCFVIQCFKTVSIQPKTF